MKPEHTLREVKIDTPNKMWSPTAKTPWIFEYSNYANAHHIYKVIAQDTTFICGIEITECREFADQTIAVIRDAVNSHEALLEAAKRLLKAHQELSGDAYAWDLLEEAIAKAESK